MIYSQPEVAEDDENAKDLEQEKETASQPAIAVTGASRAEVVSGTVTVVSGAEEAAAPSVAATTTKVS